MLGSQIICRKSSPPPFGVQAASFKRVRRHKTHHVGGLFFFLRMFFITFGIGNFLFLYIFYRVKKRRFSPLFPPFFGVSLFSLNTPVSAANVACLRKAPAVSLWRSLVATEELVWWESISVSRGVQGQGSLKPLFIVIKILFFTVES